jgi:hypothetical protein
MTTNTITLRLCAGPDCDVDLAGERPNKLYCSDSCKQRAAYARSGRHKEAQERHQVRRQERLETTPDKVQMRSMWRQMRRIKAKIREEDPEAFAPLRPEVDLKNPFGSFRVPTAEDVEGRREEILERLGRSELAGLLNAAFDELGIGYISAFVLEDGRLGFMTDGEVEEVRAFMLGVDPYDPNMDRKLRKRLDQAAMRADFDRW